MSAETYSFHTDVHGIGHFRVRPLSIEDDVPWIYDWVNRDYARYWGMQQTSPADVAAAYRARVAEASVFMGFYADQPTFLMECYDPRRDPVGEHYAVQPGDRGMHILVAPATERITGFTWGVFTVVMDFMFSDPAVSRIVVEPDARNDKIHVLNKRAGFEYQKTIHLPHKVAQLAFCTRSQYHAALEKESTRMTVPLTSAPDLAAAHLQPEVWTKVNTLHVRKAISEFAHELLIRPQLERTVDGWGHYVLATDRPQVQYRFRAQKLALDHWHIDHESIAKFEDGNPAPLDSLSLIGELSETLGIAPTVLPTYLEEIASTLCSSAYKHGKAGLTAAELTRADYQDVEAAMMEGHPAFLANNGRLGFDAVDYGAYAPEAAAPVRLLWLAGHESRATFAAVPGLAYADLLGEELDAATRESFQRTLQLKGLEPKSYFLIPVHPWQWFNKLTTVFAPDIATRHLVCLGYGPDSYRAQQSIRTFFNTTHPHKRYVKTALSVLNMGFVRGLSPYYMSTTPAINDYISRLIAQDAYLTANGFNILREVASVGYRNQQFESALKFDSPYKKMLAALWRESPLPMLRPGQRLMTMASLLHTDRHGTAALPELIKSSGLDTTAWLRRYLRSYLSPLIHCFYAHDLVFMPHGENLILVLENNIPVKVFIKDIAEEIGILNPDANVPEKARRIAVSVPEELKVLSLFVDVFDLIFRYLSQILVEHSGYPENQFWRLVAECVLEYQREQPQFREKFARYDLFAPEFIRSCVNRLQLGNNQQMIDLADPAKNLKFAGTLINPIATFRTTASETLAASA